MEEKNWIMVVDDDRSCLDMIEEIIGEAYNVTLASSGSQALEILRKGKIPDLILLDISMPGMDGYETFRNIRNMKEISVVPVIFLTGKTDSADELAGLELGAQDYITKPFIRENLLIRVHLRLENGRQARKFSVLKEQIQQTDINGERFDIMAQQLTQTEKKITHLIRLGYDNQEIAQQLHYSNGHVKNQITKIYDKLNLRNRYELWNMFQER